MIFQPQFTELPQILLQFPELSKDGRSRNGREWGSNRVGVLRSGSKGNDGSRRNEREQSGRSSSRSGDARNQRSGTGGRPGRYENRPGERPMNIGAITPLEKSDNRWERGQGAETQFDALVKKVKGILNKLTLDKFEKLTNHLVKLLNQNVDEAELLKMAIAIIFDKALSEGHFAPLYARLCHHLSKELP